MRTALPLLSQAERVVVLQVGTPERDLPALFDGLALRRATAAPSGGELGVQLLAMAHEADADMLVMGSSGGRLRERLFDGTTESLLRVADLPILMQHVSCGSGPGAATGPARRAGSTRRASSFPASTTSFTAGAEPMDGGMGSV